MRGLSLMVMAAVLGALAYWGLSRFLESGDSSAQDPGARLAAGSDGRAAGPASSGEEGAPSPGGSVAPSGGAGPPRLAGRTPGPRFHEGRPDAARGAEPPPEPPGSAPPSPEPPEVRIAPAVSGDDAAARPEWAVALEENRKLARAALEAGDRARATRLHEQIYAVARDRTQVDLTPEVTLLLEGAASRERKLDYLRYLAARDPARRVFDEQLARCERKLAQADEGAEEANAAWDELTLAYEIAGDRAQKRRVMGLVETFIGPILDGRYSPLLTGHSVQPGDSLSTIAATLKTTVDALRRINRLESTVIQPGQRLRALPGTLKIFVDKSDYVLWATLDGRIFLELPVGLGRDKGTPPGKFVVGVRQKDPTWWRPGKAPIPPGDPANILGTRWLGFEETEEHGSGYGIHGTDNPADVGADSSAGCVRLGKEDVELLYDFVRLGTEVEILP